MANPNQKLLRFLQQQQIQLRREARAAEGQEEDLKLFSVYAVTISAVASGGNSPGTINIQADSAFMIQYMIGIAFDTVTNAEVASPRARVQIKDTGSGADLFNEPLFFRNIFGTAQLPLVVPTPRILSPNSSLLFSLTNDFSTNPVTYQMALHGRKLYNNND